MELSHYILFAAKKSMYSVHPKAESKLLDAYLERRIRLLFFIAIQSVYMPPLHFFKPILVLEIITNQILEGRNFT